MDIFTQWDDDNSGHVSRDEFGQALEQIGCHAPEAEVDAVCAL